MNKDSNKRRPWLNLLAYGVILVAVVAAAFFTQKTWMPAVGIQAAKDNASGSKGHDHVAHGHSDHDHGDHDHGDHDHGDHDHGDHDHGDHDHSDHAHGDHDHDHATEGPPDGETLKLSVQAQRNLKLEIKKAFPQTFWKRLIIPGEIIDRPGLTDRSLASPIAGVVTQVHAQQGDIIKPGDRLVTIRLVSDYLQKAQADLYKAVRETDILNQEITRIQTMADRGIIPEKRIIQLRQDIERQKSLVESGRQDLLTRGFNNAQVTKAESGAFLTSIEVNAPSTNETEQPAGRIRPITDVVNASAKTIEASQFFEVQKLVAELGHQVKPGEQIAILSDHQHLYIRGHAFKKEAANLERVMEKQWNVGVEFVEDSPEHWPSLNRIYKVRHLSNEVDPDSRTFDFFVSMENQSRTYQNEDRTAIVWRFRPGQRVRLKVPLEKIENVLVLPAAAVVRDGADVYAFQAVGNFFKRVSVHQLHQDRDNVVLANDGSLRSGSSMAQNAAASLNRVLKSQASTGTQEFHVHADGTVHSNDDH